LRKDVKFLKIFLPFLQKVRSSSACHRNGDFSAIFGTKRFCGEEISFLGHGFCKANDRNPPRPNFTGV